MKAFSGCALLIAILLFIMTGCTVGPDFRRPDMAIPDNYTPAAPPSETGGAPTAGGAKQHFAFAENLPGEWWTLFRSPELDAMIKQALADSPTVAAAQAALRKAQEDRRAQVGALFPSVDGNVSVVKQKVSGATLGTPDVSVDPFTLVNASVGVTYTLDLFGGTRRRIEALEAQEDYQRYVLEATYLTLTANIVTAAVQEASLREQIKATREILAEEQKQLEILKKQFEFGAVSKTVVLGQESELAVTASTLPPLEKQLDFTRHALSVLIGQFPGKGGLPEFHLDSLHLPESLPVSLPSQLAHQRPDIRASEALLHQACAAVGVATANLYPQITLSAGYGYQSTTFGTLFNGSSSVWNLGAGLLQPLFHGGELTAKRRSAIAAYDQASAQYRDVVLKAFQNVADVLRALETDARALQAQSEAYNSVSATLSLIEKQYELGAVNYLALLIAQRAYQKTKINLITAQAQRYADTAALFQALGGGWWKRPTSADSPVHKTGN